MRTKAQTDKTICIILAAGKGTRMRSATPKVMHKIAHKPMLMHVIDTARALKSESIVVVTAPDMANVRDAVKKHYKEHVLSAIQHHQHGTGDAVRSTKSLLEKNPVIKSPDSIVFVLYGDTPLISAETLQAMRESLLTDKELGLVILGMDIDPPNAFGKIVLDKKGYVSKIVEAKDATAKENALTLCNSGVMAIRAPLLFPLLSKLTNKNASGEYYLTDLPGLAKKEHFLCGVIHAEAEELMGVNSRIELAQAEEVYQWRARSNAMEHGVTLLDPASVFFAHDTKISSDVTIHPHVVFGPGVSVGKDSTIRSFCHIEGAKILNSAIIGPFARLRPGAVIGESSHIGNFVEIKQSTIERGAKVNHLSYIGDAHIGEAANIGAGTITCNYDGYAKHRTAVGAGAFIGSNSSLVAPVVIGDGAIVGAGSVITEDVEADALAIARGTQKQKLQWAKSFRNRKNN